MELAGGAAPSAGTEGRGVHARVRVPRSALRAAHAHARLGGDCEAAPGECRCCEALVLRRLARARPGGARGEGATALVAGPSLSEADALERTVAALGRLAAAAEAGTRAPSEPAGVARGEPGAGGTLGRETARRELLLRGALVFSAARVSATACCGLYPLSAC